MRMLVLSFCFILLFTSVNNGQAPGDMETLILRGKEQIQGAEDSWDLQQMLGARAFFERLLNDPAYPWLVHYYMGFVDVRLFNYYFSREDKEKTKEFVEDGIEHLEKAVELKDDFAEGYALLSSLLGNKIALNPLLGMTLGMRSGSLLKKAFDLAPENPRISLIAGQSAYYTPKMFGGGKEKALRHIEKAIECFQTFKVEKPIFPTWGYEEAYTYLGLIHMDQENFSEAKKSFEKALEINPNYSWVKFELMVKLEEKMAEKGIE
jgi:tetratricopeptide (TPR) repeat protein